jgi:hypothetical protein
VAVVLAHGVGSRSDLPIPLDLAMYSASMAVLVSFAALVFLWRRAKFTDGHRDGVAVPAAVQAVVDSPTARRTAQAVVLAVSVLKTAVALFGPPQSTDNLAPYAIYVTLWVGLIPASLLLGPVWRVVNPLRLLHRLLIVPTGTPPRPDMVDQLGYWPAAGALTAFVWLGCGSGRRSRSTRPARSRRRPGRAAYWTQGPGAANDTLFGTLGLLFMIGLAAVLYAGAAAANGLLARQRPVEQPGRYAHSLLPIAAGYAIAHYFSLLLLDGQATWILASNPLGRDGVDLFGTYGNAVNYTLIGTDTIAYVQVGAIVLGHVLGVVLAHDAALRAKARARPAEQLPLLAAMIAFTVGGLALLFSA